MSPFCVLRDLRYTSPDKVTWTTGGAEDIVGLVGMRSGYGVMHQTGLLILGRHCDRREILNLDLDGFTET